MIEVLDPGPLTTVQDRGRRGLARLGVGHAGALDAAEHALGNRLVGNGDEAASLEVTLGGLHVRFGTAALIAITGAGCAAGVPMRQPVAVAAGTTLRLGVPAVGLRSYLAVRGGIDVPPTLGSRSTDLLTGLGPAPVVAGDVLPIGPDPGTPIPTEFAPPRAPVERPITIWPGPRCDWFTVASRWTLTRSPYVVLPTSNRIGVRLSGVGLDRSVVRELPSEGIADGAIQVPNDGQPLVFLADHPTTGGYPVIAIVDPGDLDRLAQVRPGESIRFRWHHAPGPRP